MGATSDFDRAFANAGDVLAGVVCVRCGHDMFPRGCLCRRQDEYETASTEAVDWLVGVDVDGMTPGEQRMLANATRSALGRARKHFGVQNLVSDVMETFETEERLHFEILLGNDNQKWRPGGKPDYTFPDVW